MKISNVTLALGHSQEQSVFLKWELGEHRFHIRVSRDGFREQDIIYKNLIAPPRFGAPPPRKLDPNVKANAAMLDEAKAFAREHDLLGIAVAKDAERQAEKEMREGIRLRQRIAMELGPQAIDALRCLIECFGLDALRGCEAQCPGLDDARALIKLAEEGERQKFKCRAPGHDYLHEVYAINAQAAREKHAFDSTRPGDRGPWLPDEIALEEGA